MKQSSPADSLDLGNTTASLRVMILPGKTWVDYDSLAASAYTRGNLAEAVAMWEAALRLAEGTEASYLSTGTAHILEQLVCAHYDSGDLKRAEIICKRALIAITNVYGSQHAKVGNCLTNLAGIYFRDERFVDAKVAAQSVVSIYEKHYGSQHPEVGLAMHNLAMIYQAQGKHMHAERYYRRAYALRAGALGVEHPSAVKVIMSYTALLESTGRASEAQRILSKISSNL